MEFDAQFAADGELMAIHDDTLDRTTDWTGPVSAHTSSELAGCNAAAKFDGWTEFESVPRVRDLLTEGRDAGWNLICEIKNIPGQARFDHSGESYAEELVKLVEETSFPVDRLVMICFWMLTLDAVKRRRDDIALGFLSVPDLAGDLGISAEGNIETCLSHGFQIAAPRHSTPDLTADAVQRAHDRGLQVHVWTPNEPDQIAAAVSKNLDGITSDFPDRVYDALGRA
jgi:glycerophosphoryl diester phosphodiesterase